MSAAPPSLREGRHVFAGHGYHWELYGTGARETVCLLNGLAMSTKSWLSFLPELTPTYDVLLFDYLGQGASDDAEVKAGAIPAFGDALAGILDAADLGRVHAVGVSYGGFVAADFARLHGDRLHTLTLSGVLLTKETLFSMYQDMSLRFYRGGPELFDLYTRYLYEKIFGEAFVTRVGEKLEAMRGNFRDRYRDRIEALVRLTEAQNPFFAALEANAPRYAAIRCPVLVLAGAEDRAIPPSQQRKIAAVIPHARYEEIEGSGHVVYLERPDLFWPRVRRFFGSKDPRA
ncbi:MAG TPA: alpha/beta hydrolase [Thermoanaerobaculia bacterium]|nr:alpha/beta hydrolase [Thermoanaerobaculia bacterium]